MRPVIQKSLDNWAEFGILPGDFLQAVLRNELMDAVFRADVENLADLLEICRYVYNALPSQAWGSRTAIQLWKERDPEDRRIRALSCRADYRSPV